MSKLLLLDGVQIGVFGNALISPFTFPTQYGTVLEIKQAGANVPLSSIKPSIVAGQLTVNPGAIIGSTDVPLQVMHAPEAPEEDNEVH